MTSNRVIGIWLLTQLIPLVILYFVYTFFSAENFFKLEGAWKGVVASGPIAAYVFLTWMSFRYFKDLLSISFRLNEDAGSVVGTWVITSTSERGRIAKGSCDIALRDNKLEISGNYKEDSGIETIWQSDIAFLDSNSLFYVYKLESNNVGYIGYVRLRIVRTNKKKALELRGEWVAIGHDRKRGNINISREG